MPLPDLIEIVPLDKPVQAEITVPGSKSITNRALILAALAEGETTLRGALWSEDTQVMVEALRVLGFEVRVEPEPAEFCNRTITVKGLGGKVPNAGTAEKPLELFVGNAGTAARFLAAFVCLGHGVYRLSGVPRMHERPQAALFAALRQLGYRLDAPNDRLPVTIHGVGWQPGTCRVSIAESSQFASALLLGAQVGGWKVKVLGDDAEEAPYVKMTERLIEAFPRSSGRFDIEPDASSGSYFWAAGWLVAMAAWMSQRPGSPEGIRAQLDRITDTQNWLWECLSPKGPRDYARFPVVVRNWPTTGWQVDGSFPEFLPLPQAVSREGQLGDAIMTAIVLAADSLTTWGIAGVGTVYRFTDLGRLRLQECERVSALITELRKCGVSVSEEGDSLEITPSLPHGAKIETYNDHRMAMCFAILGLKVPGVKLKNPACVKKTFPNFFQKLAAPPPGGLGAEIRDARTGRRLSVDELFAD